MLRILVAFLLTSPCVAADWPQFRGPTGDGLYIGDKLPTEWGTDKNVAWKTPIPGKGWSSPIVWKGKIFLTTAVASDSGDQSLRALCVDATSGKIDWNEEALLAPNSKASLIHPKNSPASPTPTIDGERLYVHFGHMGTAALDLNGKVIWTRTGFTRNRNTATAGRRFSSMDYSCLAATDRTSSSSLRMNVKDGKTAWQTPRNNKADRSFSFSTPTVVDMGGKKQS